MRTLDKIAIHQFVPALFPRDAVGNHTLETHRALDRAGVNASIWSDLIDPSLTACARPYREFMGRRRRSGRRPVVLYQAASESNGMVDFLLQRSESKLLCYHNFTPPEYFDPYDSATAAAIRRAQIEVRRLAPHVSAALSASEFSAADLHEIGIEEVHVIPPFVGSRLSYQPDRTTAERLRAGKNGIDLLFVGRVVPNKGHAHLIRIIAAVRAAVDPRARLFIVGPAGPRLYMDAVHRLADRVAPSGVIFTGAVSDSQLVAYYQHADVFLSMSEHEGFGVPLVEAMRAGMPIVAYDTSAVGETLSGTGVLVRTPDPMFVAEIIAKVTGDPGLRSELGRRERERALELESFPRVNRILDMAAHAAN
jgi:L-malate glycosyltransferase